MSRRRITVIGILAACLAAVGAVLVAAPPALAAGSCNQRVSVRLNVGYSSSAQIPASGQSDPTNCSMTQGAQNDAVKRLQQNLNQCYSSQLRYGISGSGLPYPGALLAEDGQFGPNTYKGLKLAQYYESQAGPAISVDGMYGPQTRSALRWWGSYYTANDQPRTGCYRVKMPIEQLSSVTPTLPPPVTRYNEVWAGWRQTDQGDITQVETYEIIRGWVRGTISGSRGVLSAEGGWSLAPDKQLLVGGFFLEIWDCTTNTLVANHLVAVEQPTTATSGTYYVSYTGANPSHTYRMDLIGDGDVDLYPNSGWSAWAHFSYSVPPWLEGTVVPYRADTGCF